MSPRPMRGADCGRRARARIGPASARAAEGARASTRGSSPQGPRPELASLLPPDWRTAVYLALDFETTGLDPARERVVEVGAIRFMASAAGPASEQGALCTLVRPGIPIPRQVVAIHGIRDADVEHAPPFAEIGPSLAALASGAWIVAHNAPFDLSFLRGELARAGLPQPLNPVLDTRVLAKAAFPGLPSYRLVDLAARFGIDAGTSHRALDDARTCMSLLLLCAARSA